MSTALNIATAGLSRAGERFEDAAGRIVRGGARQAEQIQTTTGVNEAADRSPSPPTSSAGLGVQSIGQPLSNDMTSALIDMKLAEFDFSANARVMTKAYEMTDALLDATEPKT